jgi:hypothetical protein
MYHMEGGLRETNKDLFSELLARKSDRSFSM